MVGSPRHCFLCVIAGLVLLVGLTLLPQEAAAAEQWKAGVAKANITPETFMWMSGYGSRNHPAEGKDTDLWGKVLVLEDPAGNRAVLITLDLVGIDRALSQGICAGLEQKYGLKRQQVALNCSHTHSGPVVSRNLQSMYVMLDETQKKLIAEYTQTLEEKVIATVGTALEKLMPANFSWGSGKATFAVNRRTNVENNVPALRAAGQLKGPNDHDVPVLAVRSPDGKLLAVTFGYACHSTVLPFYNWSGDYPAYAQIELERAYPDCTALFWAGCGADQNPIPRREVALAQHYGKTLAQSVAAIIDAPMTPIAGTLGLTYQEVDLALDTLPTKEQIEQDAQSKDKYVASRAMNLLAQINAGKPLSQTYPYPVGTWKLGDQVEWVFLGGEVVVDFAVRIKGERAGTKTWVAGYSHDVMAYIPSRRVLTEGGYEGAGAMVYYGLPTSWSPAVEETIMQEVQRQAK